MSLADCYLYSKAPQKWVLLGFTKAIPHIVARATVAVFGDEGIEPDDVVVREARYLKQTEAWSNQDLHLVVDLPEKPYGEHEDQIAHELLWQVREHLAASTTSRWKYAAPVKTIMVTVEFTRSTRKVHYL